MDDEVRIEPLVETENYEVVRVTDPEGQVVYHLDLFNLTIRFFEDEWDEFVGLIMEAAGDED